MNIEFLPTVKTDTHTLINGDALTEMAKLPTGSVDLVCVDLPYGVTQNKWDIPLPFEEMWTQFHRITKKKGAVVLTAAQPFAAMLIMSNLKYFKYEIIWEKTVASNQLNVRFQPLRVHENILVFAKGSTTYNEQKTVGEPYSIKRNGKYRPGNYGAQKASEKQNTGFRHARSVVKISNPRIKDGHPTQKPIELMSYIINTFSNKGDVVIDCCMGSGSTGVACAHLERFFIGIELSSEYFQSACEGIQNVYNQ